MTNFRMVFGKHDPGVFSALWFDARSIGDALRFVHRHYSRHPVELWRDGKYLGLIERISLPAGPVWRLG